MTTSVAEQLTQAREAKGLSIDEVAKATRVSPRLIRALETGDFGAFSAAFYARGCVGILARFYRLKGRALKRQFAAEYPASRATTGNLASTDLPDYWCYWIACLRLDSIAPWALSILLLAALLGAYSLGHAHGAKQHETKPTGESRYYANFSPLTRR